MRSTFRLAAETPSALDLSSAFRKGGNGRLAARGGSLRQLHCSPIRASGSILNLGGLSISRESRFLSKERGIPRTEFSPHLELIRSSEVDPFVGKDKPTSSPQTFLDPPLTPHIREALRGINYISKELEIAKEGRAKSEAALRDLRSRYKTREKEAFSLALVTTVLVVGALFSQEFGDWLDPMLGRIWNIRQVCSSAGARIFPKSWSSPSTQSPRLSQMEESKEQAMSVAVDIRGPKFAWWQLFWASPD